MQARGEQNRPSHSAIAAVHPSPGRALPIPIVEALKSFAAQDWYMLGFCAVLFAGLLRSTSPERMTCLRWATFDFVVLSAALLLVRGQILRGVAAWLTYRLTIFFGVLGIFFQLKMLLPAITSRVIDADVLAFDLAVFHYEPAIAWDAYVTPARVEWFAFFYYGYFFLVGLHAFPIAFGVRKNTRLLGEFGLGIVLVYCTGHLCYLLVPGYGPYHHLAGQFAHPLEGGLWWRLVGAAVDSAGSQKDIFPSLHTAAPTFMALLQFRYRKIAPFKYTWPIVALFTSQIILATMFLRWHWMIDVIAGLALASVAMWASARIVGWETARRERLRIAPVWPALSR